MQKVVLIGAEQEEQGVARITFTWDRNKDEAKQERLVILSVQMHFSQDHYGQRSLDLQEVLFGVK